MSGVICRGMTEQPADKRKTALEKKALAGRARRLAQTQTVEADRLRLMHFADELDKEAEAPELLPAPAAPMVRQVQQQVQQQESSEPVPGVSLGNGKD